MAKKVNETRLYSAIAVSRIGLGLIFLWAFVDKLIGLGFATCRGRETDAIEVLCKDAWLKGGSPTNGFLSRGTDGPLADFYQGLASTNPHSLVNWLFMVGLLGIGVALVFGIGVRIAAISGSIMMILMWSAALLPANNPVLDDHIIYTLLLMVILFANNKQKYGLRDWWIKQNIVKKYPVLE